ncbi:MULTISPECIES: ABC transporter permease subunit [unclassified Mesorhizobium]|uniref:ABC transporter permease n=1 Tax=unclassified Mesorhizobium TaxID=325217 RepID=UPI000FCB85F2|nr:MULTISPECIES: ABC transporter permease subunit [unclassified Mesorhizobium]RUX91992.1 ABC transporter permease subunit [Mesorhizobium sp. M7D.F.Ca.US.004.01.2.1]RVA29771.1 ABC transporter permease subunit [Mesorhizobium sp. M7D.F.Ca.US.004.03.1.1]
MLQSIIDFSANYSPIDFVLIVSQWRLFLTGFINTVILFVLTTGVGAMLAVPLGIARAQKVPVANPVIFVYSYLFRGTPLLVQTYLLYFGAGEVAFIKNSFAWAVLRDPWWCAFIAFSLNTAAYVTEIVRGGLEAVPPGEVEAARACGMLPVQRMYRIILPSAFRRALPMYSNEVIFALHGTVVASTITIVDVLGAGRTLNGMFYLAYEGFITAALIYAAIALTVTRTFRWMERRFNRHLQPRTG